MSEPLFDARANKALGQHFLFDPDVLRRIAGLLGPLKGLPVVEVGPGPGGLTRALLAHDPARLTVIEKDTRFAEALGGWPEAVTGQLRVIEADALELDAATLAAEGEATLPRLIANLPYNVGTPLLVGWLKQSARWGPMALMFQKEVAQRICAPVGHDLYGRLGVLAQSARRCRIAMTLPPGAFRPPPKVASAVVTLEALPSSEAFDDLAALEVITAAAFGQRRKMLRSSLAQATAQVGMTPEALLAAADITPTLRAEEVPVAGFHRLARAWRANAT